MIRKPIEASPPRSWQLTGHPEYRGGLRADTARLASAARKAANYLLTGLGGPTIAKEQTAGNLHRPMARVLEFGTKTPAPADQMLTPIEAAPIEDLPQIAQNNGE